MASSCPECGTEVGAGTKFCGECGTRLNPTQSTVSYAPAFFEEDAEESSESAALIELDQVEGTAGRRMHDVGHNSISVGRSHPSDIVLDDVTVSREHARISLEDRGFKIVDSGSLNGTYVNRVRVDSVYLRNGDEIQIGKYRFKFVFT
jgi:pSer/pThr/pTyr-binding forkhead associated (FHA) protein